MTVASFIAAQRTDHRVPHAKCCRWLGVSESWFYKWRNRPPTARDERRGRLDVAVKRSFDVSGGVAETYGSPRVFEDLIEDGWNVSINTVAASMASQGLQGRSPKRKRRSLTRPDKAAEPVADLVRRDFSAETVDEKWCGDLTEIPTGEGKLYLAIVEDLASRRLCGFAIGEHHDAALAKAALCMAGAVRGGDIDGVIFHSDKGGVSTPATSSPKHARRSGSPSRWAESPRLWTTRSPKASTRHWNGNCCHAAISPPLPRPAARSPGSSRPTTTPAATAAAR